MDEKCLKDKNSNMLADKGTSGLKIYTSSEGVLNIQN